MKALPRFIDLYLAAWVDRGFTQHPLIMPLEGTDGPMVEDPVTL